MNVKLAAMSVDVNCVFLCGIQEAENSLLV